jgi:acyl carrier protein
MLDLDLVKKITASVMEVDFLTLGEDASMDSIPTWDSLRQMNLVLALEESFGVSIPDEDAANATSYKLLVLVLQEQLVGS